MWISTWSINQRSIFWNYHWKRFLSLMFRPYPRSTKFVVIVAGAANTGFATAWTTNRGPRMLIFKTSNKQSDFCGSVTRNAQMNSGLTWAILWPLSDNNLTGDGVYWRFISQQQRCNMRRVLNLFSECVVNVSRNLFRFLLLKKIKVFYNILEGDISISDWN